MSRLRSLFTGVMPVILVVPTVGLLGTPVAAGVQSASGAPQQVTFSRDVVRILQRKCQVCHRPGSIAPMSLLTYESARPWARAMKQQVLERAMPPWYVDRTVGIQKFKADRSLSDQEIETIVTWVDAGAPRGDPADLPPPLEFPDQSKLTLLSTLGEPDIVYGIPEPFVIDAEGANIWVDLFSDPGITEDRWIRAVETKPSLSGFPVVHHSSTWMFDPSAPDDFSNFSEYALGKTGDVFADGAGRFLKAGTQFRFKHTLRAERHRDDRSDQRRAVAVSKRVRAQVPACPERDRRRVGPRYSSGRDLAPRRLHGSDRECPSDGVPAPPTQPREAAVSGDDQSHRSYRDRELRGLEFRLAHYLQLRDRRAAAAAEGDGAAHHDMA